MWWTGLRALRSPGAIDWVYISGGTGLSERIPIFPLHTILFPSTDLGLHVFEDRYRSLVARCLESGEGFGVVLIRRGREVSGPAEPHTIGTHARIVSYARLPDGRYLLEVEGHRRCRIESLNGSVPYPQADVTWLPEPIGNFAEAREMSMEAERLFHTYRVSNGDGDMPVRLPVDPVSRSYVLASLLKVDPHEKQTLLETDAADDRLERVVGILRRELALLGHLHSKRG